MDNSNETQSSEASVDFTGLILGFCSAALSYMGYSTNEGAPTGSRNLELAKQNIDIIELLKEKTVGNLSAEEAKLTDQVLADLQMKYVEVSK